MIDSEALLKLHRDLIAIPSVSHEEKEIADFVEDWLKGTGADVLRLGDNVIASASTSPKLLLNSHLDTVPPTDALSRSPLEPSSEGGTVYGLGANDTKGSVACMMTAFKWALESGQRDVAIMLVPEEETGGKGTEIAWPHVRDELDWRPEGIIVGEPTELQIGFSQSGLLVLELVSEGVACHAANAHEASKPNPIFALARDLARVPDIRFPGAPTIGQRTTIQPTVISGATARNQVPAEARAVLDLRTLPGQSHAEIVEQLSSVFESRIDVRSRRLEPFACPIESRLIRSIQSALPNSRPFHSRTMSDLVFFQGENAVKLGPGVSARSHTSDEYILESEVVDGANAYVKIIQEFCA